jgi:hypothetical protein
MSDLKPCGNYHPLPCGLDVDCPVPVKHFDNNKNSKEIYRSYK